jgi:hypothetical protein
MVQRTKGNGTYAPLSATYYRDDALLEAGEHAELLYVRGLAYCAENPSDGFISDRQLRSVIGVNLRGDITKRAATLVELELWSKVTGGYVVRSWLKWNKSADEIGRYRKQDRERKARKDGGQGDLYLDDSERNPNGIRTDSATIPGSNALHVTTDTQHNTSVQRKPENPATQKVIGNWIDHCDHRPPARVIGQVSKQVKELIEEGIDPAHVERGLAQWASKDLSPSLIPSLVNSVMNARAAPANGTASMKAKGWLDLGNNTPAIEGRTA